MLNQLRYSILLLFILSSVFSKGQCLNETISIDCQPCTLEEALEILEAQVPCSFSYNATQLNIEQSIHFTESNIRLRDALQKLTGEQYELKQRGRHVMIISKTNTAPPTSEQRNYIIEGYVRDAKTGQTVQHASVYAVGKKYTALTNSEGYYRMQMNTDAEFVGLSYSKQQYFDTIIVVRPANEPVRQDIALMRREEKVDKMPLRSPDMPERKREVEELPMVKILVPQRQSNLALNLEFFEKIPVQLSLLPSIGTNRYSSGIKKNILSLNVISGYNAGVIGFEAGGVVNILRKNMIGMQVGGVGNIVGGQVRGIQAAGAFNNVRGSIKGVQLAGVYNIVLDTVKGAQASGVFNVLNGSITGTQLAGVFNVATESMSGIQAAGLFNVTRKDVKVGQLAGLFNLSGEVTGAQIAGAFNYANGEVTGTQLAGAGNISRDDLIGTQAAGAFNYARNVRGDQIAGAMNVSKDVNAQISGFLNVARKVEGAQLGVINISDSAAKAFGVLSFSRKGYNHIDVHTDEVHFANASVRMGVKGFYNVLTVGYGSYEHISIWSYGYGVGTEIGEPDKRTQFNLELLARQLVHPPNQNKGLNLNVHFDPSISIRFGEKRGCVVFGPSINTIIQTAQLQNTDPDQGEYMNPQSRTYPPIYNALQGTIDGKFWIGGKVGLRI